MKALLEPRLWLMIVGGVGVIGAIYVLFAASAPSDGRPGAGSGPALDRALLVGEMADFEYTFPPRRGPDVAFDHNGRSVTLANFRGRTVLVNFWATWCAPCLKELPSLDALQGELGGRSFQVVAVASDPRGPEAAQAFLDRLGIVHLDLYADPRLTFITAVGGDNVLPLSILYGPDGAEIGRLTGEADWASPEAKRLVRAAMAG